MRWLYRLQTRAGLTAPEGTAALVIVVALAVGVVVGEVESNASPVGPDFYAAADAAFAAASAAPDSAGSGAPRPILSSASEGAPSGTGAGAPGDSTAAQTAAQIAERVVRDTSPRGGSLPPVRTDLNAASAEDLQRLPGIGPALAQRVLDYRREHGRFRSAEEIVEVKGIGPKTLEKLAPWIYVR